MVQHCVSVSASASSCACVCCPGMQCVGRKTNTLFVVAMTHKLTEAGKWASETIPPFFLWLFESLSFHSVQLLAYAPLTHALNLSNAEFFKWAVCPCGQRVTWKQPALKFQTFYILKTTASLFFFLLSFLFFICQLTVGSSGIEMLMCNPLFNDDLYLYYRLHFVIYGGFFSCDNFHYQCKSLGHASMGA